MSTKWLVGFAESRDDSHPGWDEVGWLKISSHLQNGTQFKTWIVCFWNFYLLFLDLTWLQFTGTSEKETESKRGLQKWKQRLSGDYCSFWGVYHIRHLEAFEKIWVYFSHPHFYRVGSSCYLFIKGLLEVEISSSKALKNYSVTQTPNQCKSFW